MKSATEAPQTWKDIEVQETVPTDRKKARETLLGQLMQLALNAADDDFDVAVRGTLGHLADYYGAGRIAIYGRRADGGLRKLFDWTHRSGMPPLGPETVDAQVLPETLEQIQSGSGLRLPRGAANPFLDSAVYLMPMFSGRRMAGVLIFDQGEVLEAGALRDPNLLSMIADLLLTLTQQARPRLDAQGQSGDPLSNEIRTAAHWAMPDLMFEIGPDGRLRSVVSPDSPHEIDAPGLMAGALLEEALPADLARDLRNYMREIDENDRVQCRIHRFSTANSSAWYEVSGSHCAPRRRGEGLGYLLVLRDITDRIESETELQRLGRVVELMTNLVAIIDTEGLITWANRAFETQTGYSLAELRGQRMQEMIGGAARGTDTAEKVLAALLAGEGCEGRDICFDRNGRPFWITFNMQPLHDAQGALSGFVIVATVITKQLELENALRAERDFLSTVTETGVSALVVCSADGRCIFSNSEAGRILDSFDPGRSLPAALWPFSPVVTNPASAAIPFSDVATTRAPVRDLMFSRPGAEGRRVIYSVNASPLSGAQPSGQRVISLTDVTARFDADEARRAVAEKALYDADHDLLTDLPNRRHFNRMLGRAMDAGGLGRVYVLSMDLDKFKRIRTVLGQDIGNRLICLLAARITAILGGKTRLARTESDCFVAFVDCDGPEIAERIAHTLCQAIAEPCELDGATFYLTSSIGISVQEPDDVSPEALLRKAELAIEMAKSAGGNRFAHYSAGMEQRFARSTELIQALRLALKRREFQLVFQPKFSLQGEERLVGAEALLRLNSSRLGKVRPDEFIMVAETSGMITEIDYHVMELFAQQMGRWHGAGHALNASINISPRSFEATSLAPRMLEVLAAHGVPYSAVTVEITETSLVAASGNALANIDQLRDSGMAISVDDFGTGYSSLSYLQRLIASEIKIDRSFITPLSRPEANEGATTILRAILALADRFGLLTVAEGVETETQKAWLRREGCSVIQGYLGGRAVPPEDFERRYLLAPMA
ncbi:EAL domain-containing protein [Pseudooceanicola sp. CBS1P-1]|uniref:EAL domain-containing protein n=1 Tax=Pseudooceanicola albus TaxID=2692189 RepID=A0A6L7G1U7_9RHOB|nr:MULTISPECIES: EAL domain-containing protein [Pseudooceanicola]MBT9385025.1 EAL domain-containing protein [Pseudooceanicola endophyticus]MXN17981.1 EAL domain-containing protein [Pseudooceanicola albus]